jgi:hypothetical protein
MRIGGTIVGLLVVAAVAAVQPSSARADERRYENVMVGPLFGFRLSGPSGHRGIIGVEGGVGLGPERLNGGHTWRRGETFTYVELDPWYLIGGTLGVGRASTGDWSPVIGVWEGIPILGGESNRHCDAVPDDGWHATVTASAGYRYAGVHELYVTVKGGAMNGYVCFD